MAPTTMLGQVTATTPNGRNATGEGYPLQVSEILALLPGAIYVERCALSSVSRIKEAKRAMKHAFQLQMDGAPGLSLVEILSPCPTYWRMSPAKAMTWIEEQMSKAFPIGRLKG